MQQREGNKRTRQSKYSFAGLSVIIDHGKPLLTPGVRRRVICRLFVAREVSCFCAPNKGARWARIHSRGYTTNAVLGFAGSDEGHGADAGSGVELLEI